MRLAALMFVGCVVVWASAVNFGQSVHNAAAVAWTAAAVVSTDMFGLAAAAILADVFELAVDAAAVVLVAMIA